MFPSEDTLWRPFFSAISSFSGIKDDFHTPTEVELSQNLALEASLKKIGEKVLSERILDLPFRRPAQPPEFPIGSLCSQPFTTST